MGKDGKLAAKSMKKLYLKKTFLYNWNFYDTIFETDIVIATLHISETFEHTTSRILQVNSLRAHQNNFKNTIHDFF